MKINKADYIKGEIELPGDKSISHRAAILTAMAKGKARISNFSTGEDCAATLECLQNLGVEICRENGDVLIEGVGKNGFTKPENHLFCANSGTTMRLLAGVLAGQNFESVLTGDASLSKRPMRRIIEPFTRMNAEMISKGDHAPLEIRGKNPLSAIEYELKVASAQVKSSILLAGLNADGITKIKNPPTEAKISGSRNHTEILLKHLGAEIENEFIKINGGFVEEISVNSNSELNARNLFVSGDISSSAFFAVAAACLKNSEILIKNVNLNPTRTVFLELMKSLGCGVEITKIKEDSGELIGDLLVTGKRKKNQTINKIEGAIIARLIDEIPIIAVLASQTEGGLEIRDAAELRFKETDRIKAVAENLRKMNAKVEEFDDGLKIEKSELKAAQIDSYGDHRIAMAFSIAALFAEGETEIAGADCVNVSFPEFFEILKNIVK